MSKAPKFKDLTNRKFSFLTALSPSVSKDNYMHWNCICDCGTTCEVKSASLLSGNTKSCGCFYRKDLTGKRFGRLTVQYLIGRSNKFVSKWQCLCDCGKSHAANGGHLCAGNTQSCGCLARENMTFLTHGLSRTTEANSYYGAKKRCSAGFTEKNKDYFGRGIEFRFPTFEDFLKDVGPKPSIEHSLDRIDNDGHYEPGNVRWATKKEQARNRRCDNCTELKKRILELEERISERNQWQT